MLEMVDMAMYNYNVLILNENRIANLRTNEMYMTFEKCQSESWLAALNPSDKIQYHCVSNNIHLTLSSVVRP